MNEILFSQSLVDSVEKSLMALFHIVNLIPQVDEVFMVVVEAILISAILELRHSNNLFLWSLFRFFLGGFFRGLFVVSRGALIILILLK